MPDRGKRLAGDLCISGGFKPTHSTDRIIILTGGIVALNPASGPWPTGRVTKQGHGINAGKDGPVLTEFLFPILRLLITAAADELLELPVSDFVPIDPVVSDRHRRNLVVAGNVEECGWILSLGLYLGTGRKRDTNHPGRAFCLLVQDHRGRLTPAPIKSGKDRAFDRPKASLLDLPA